MRQIAAVFLIVTAYAAAGHAQQEPISADQPGFANGSSIVGAGTLQVETGAELDHQNGSTVGLPTLLRYGLSDAFELRLGTNTALFSHGDVDLAPVAIGFKLKLRVGSIPLSVIASVQPPSGEGVARTSEFEGDLRLVSDIDLGNNLVLTPNAGLGLQEGERPTAIIAATLTKNVGKAAPFVDFEFHAGSGDPSLVLDGGIAWLVSNDTQLDVAGGVGVTGNDFPDWFIAAGVSERF
ncbi:MAG TPA: transporter [Thermoanaerobaculia bacterium]|nr:transporter [Thermoanaerobaculia bacterium]